MTNDDIFERVAEELHLDLRGNEYAFAHAFWERLGDSQLRECAATDQLRHSLVCEEVLVWRVLVARMLREIANAALFRERDAGAAKGTVAVHPALDALAKVYERLRRSANEAVARIEGGSAGRELGLPDIMKPILEETEVVFDELFGPGSFPGRAPANGKDQGADSSE